ncbi:STN domain-containing protein [Pseudomonas sp. NCCP-436]|uniref:STN domain-containing protein n=1 Tax=Pseudomonas sp. NCCP-436 TaxID=2842481 RepID=UPI0035D080D8
MVERRQTDAVNGQLSVDQTIAQALHGSGLGFSRDADAIIIIPGATASLWRPPSRQPHRSSRQ